MHVAAAAQQANAQQQEQFANKILKYFAGKEKETTLCVWGLAFKAKTDDIRESPAIYCVQEFVKAGMKVRAYDPEAATAAKQALDDTIETFDNGYDALDGADALVVLTDWQEFRNPDFGAIKAKLKKPVIFDGRNLYELDYVGKAGFAYHSIGRKIVSPGQT